MNVRSSKLLLSVMLIVVLALPALAVVPFAGAQEGPQPAKIELVPYEGNPILTLDVAHGWEKYAISRARVVNANGLLHLFYTAYGETGGSVGYATSEDGLEWTKYGENPVFVPGPAIAPSGVMEFAVLLDDETWKIYFTPWLENREWWDLAHFTLVATAPSPTGPWTVAPEPVLTSDKTGWDVSGRWIISVIRADNEYRMFYESSNLLIGMATSPDGLHWIKYDDPATPATTSDPLFEPNSDPGTWDSGFVASPVVRQTEDGWEMFYGAGGSDPIVRSIGYATSPDGITWTRHGSEPLLRDSGGMTEPDAVVQVNGTDYLYYTTSTGIAVATIKYE